MSLPHPPKDRLIAFGQGKLTTEESSSVERHLEACRECCETLLDLKDDTFVGLVRVAKPLVRFGSISQSNLRKSKTIRPRTETNQRRNNRESTETPRLTPSIGVRSTCRQTGSAPASTAGSNDDTFDNQALIKDETGRVLLDGSQGKRRKK
jgi:anti-sigma factor RsiW